VPPRSPKPPHPPTRRRVKIVRPETIDGNAEWATMNGFPSELPAAMGEADFQTVCEDVLRRYGWTVYHETDSRKSDKGLPDLVAVSRPQDDDTIVLLMIELKTRKGVTSEDQELWLEKLSRVNVMVTGLARPADWPALSALFFDPLGVCLRSTARADQAPGVRSPLRPGGGPPEHPQG
jgi:hypothetical protein